MQNMRALLGTDGHITLVFNSLDQLAARFPLCARENIFVPGIIETLTAEAVTSIFVAVEEPGQPEEQYALLSMADLILQFRREQLTSVDYLDSLRPHVPSLRKRATREALLKAMDEHHEAVVARIVRHAGGQAAGGGGVLELVDRHSFLRKVYRRDGRQVSPLKQGVETIPLRVPTQTTTRRAALS